MFCIDYIIILFIKYKLNYLPCFYQKKNIIYINYKQYILHFQFIKIRDIYKKNGIFI